MRETEKIEEKKNIQGEKIGFKKQTKNKNKINNQEKNIYYLLHIN